MEIHPYTLFALDRGAGGIILVLVPSLAYVIANWGERPLRQLRVALPGIVLGGAFVAAAWIAPEMTVGRLRPTWWIYQGVLALGMLLVIPACVASRATAWLHALQASTVAGAGYLWFIGGMTLSHRWL